jgi:pimeloyl-ACP methyl ester carboxylesterase
MRASAPLNLVRTNCTKALAFLQGPTPAWGLQPWSSMATTIHVQTTTVDVLGQRARVHLGGRGEGLLLIHGGWGSGRLHWSRVWEPLAEHFRVVAPELPGLGDTELPALPTLEAYAQWTAALLDAVNLDSAWCVGNSFGASLACRFAGDHPERCRGLVLVDGFALPPTPPLMRWLGRTALGRRQVEKMLRHNAYHPELLARGLADPAHAPDELKALVAQQSPRQLHTLVPVMVHGGGKAAPLPAPLLLWGARDRLWRTDPDSARKLAAQWPGSTLVFIEGAGHLPQFENPTDFVQALERFIEQRSEQSAALRAISRLSADAPLAP